ncbi:hypothetical protein E3N88_18027 [Mikania micrantha]|uniref:Uncharacterized protein n=1 Tax=Mikania micrantha TaxID=192012 RepID=A0A5N6NTM8_9ASTR|nr:hypothetical protein E3N88_18027 [Mikania micrantha]
MRKGEGLEGLNGTKSVPTPPEWPPPSPEWFQSAPPPHTCRTPADPSHRRTTIEGLHRNILGSSEEFQSAPHHHFRRSPPSSPAAPKGLRLGLKRVAFGFNRRTRTGGLEPGVEMGRREATGGDRRH